MNRYQQLAVLFKQQIQQKTWRAGEKLPSVRVTSRCHSLSNGTVLQAYQLLESQGWIVAKPQSGFFVAADVERPEVIETTTSINPVSINDALFDFLKSQTRQESLKFGSAFPGPSLFPLQVLNRSLASAGRKSNPNVVLDNMPPGNEALRRLIAQRYIQQGIPISHQDVVITSGALEALNLSLQAVSEPGDTVVIETPTFYGARQAVERLGLKAITVPVDAKSGMSVEHLESIFSQHDVKACWLMSNFQNPTGTSMSEGKKRKVVELARQHNVYLIEDDVYAELYYSEQKPSSLKTYDFASMDERVLHCGSLSKSLCPGFRLGWVVTRRYNQDVQKLQLLSTLSGSAPIQQGVAHYLQNDSYDNHLRKLRRTLLKRQQWMINELKRHLPEVEFEVPSGGYFIWLKLPKGVSSEDVYQNLKQHNILIAPEALFAQSFAQAGYIRLNTSLADQEQLSNAIVKMSQEINLLLTV